MASRDSLSTGLQNLCISVRSGIEQVAAFYGCASEELYATHRSSCISPFLFASIALETGYSSIEDGYGIERTTSFLLIDSLGNLVTFTLHPHEEANDLGQGSSLV